MEELQSEALSGHDSSAPSWVYKSTEIRRWTIVLVGVIAAIVIGKLVKAPEGLTAQADATVAQLKSNNATKPNLQGGVHVDSSATVNDVREVKVALQLQNSGLVNVEIRKIVTTLYAGKPSVEMQAAIDAAQELAWLDEGQVGQEPESTGDVIQASADVPLVEARREELVDSRPYGKIFNVGFPSSDIEWRELEQQKQTDFKNIVLRPDGGPWTFWKDYLITEFPQYAERRWYNVSFEVTIADAEAEGGQRNVKFCHCISGEPMPGSILDENGKSSDRCVLPFSISKTETNQ